MALLNGTVNMSSLIPALWSNTLYPILKANLPLGSLFERTYEGDLRLGNTVYVNSIAQLTGAIASVDTAAFSPEAMSITQNSIVVNKRAYAACTISDLAALQSIDFQEELKQNLMYAVAKQIEDAIISAYLPSTSAPDHVITSAASALAVADLGTLRELLSVQKVPMDKRALVLSPDYYSDLLSLTQITSQDYVASRNGVEGAISRYMGFNIIEGSNLATGTAMAFHPSAIQLVYQGNPEIKISDRHGSLEFGYVISASVPFGISLFDSKRIVKMTAS